MFVSWYNLSFHTLVEPSRLIGHGGNCPIYWGNENMIGWAWHDPEQWGRSSRSFELQCDVEAEENLLIFQITSEHHLNSNVCVNLTLNSSVFFFFSAYGFTFYLVFLVLASHYFCSNWADLIEKKIVTLCSENIPRRQFFPADNAWGFDSNTQQHTSKHPHNLAQTPAYSESSWTLWLVSGIGALKLI